jgi:hypothetical protein
MAGARKGECTNGWWQRIIDGRPYGWVNEWLGGRVSRLVSEQNV